MRRNRLGFLAGLALITALRPAGAAPLIDFPTENRALLGGRPQDFFMYVDRDFEGEKSKPWQGGQFGFVRGPVREKGRISYIQLHEGVDIAPVRRDAQGIPLDPVRAAAAGRMVHVSREAGASNYGRYVVIEHLLDGSPVYTLYAHLASIAVEPGQTVAQGAPIGVLGFTGAGINRERAHVHFEVCLMLSENFPGWHEAHFPGNPNRHGLYNGLNLVGMDPARLLMESQRNPSLHLADYVRALEPTFKITINNSPNLSLIRNYPWLVAPGSPASPPAWSISFSRHGVPIKAEAAPAAVPAPTVTWVQDTDQAYTHITKGIVGGSPGAPKLTESGQRFVALLTWGTSPGH